MNGSRDAVKRPVRRPICSNSPGKRRAPVKCYLVRLDRRRRYQPPRGQRLTLRRGRSPNLRLSTGPSCRGAVQLPCSSLRHNQVEAALRNFAPVQAGVAVQKADVETQSSSALLGWFGRNAAGASRFARVFNFFNHCSAARRPAKAEMLGRDHISTAAARPFLTPDKAACNMAGNKSGR